MMDKALKFLGKKYPVEEYNNHMPSFCVMALAELLVEFETTLAVQRVWPELHDALTSDAMTEHLKNEGLQVNWEAVNKLKEFGINIAVGNDDRVRFQKLEAL